MVSVGMTSGGASTLMVMVSGMIFSDGFSDSPKGSRRC